jgi:dephospho-CoA kinase
MIKVGVTGGIGSGKSTVCKVFRVLGVPVFEADKVARQIMDTSEEVREQLPRLFGASVYLPDQSINRKYLAGLVFNDPSLLEQLNKLIHPLVRKAFYDWCILQEVPYVIHEAAILFESGFYRMMDKTITVVTNESERVERVMKRENIPAELVKQRMKNQWTDEEKMKLADFIIGNNENELVIAQIIEIDKKLRAYG